jgi:hypothetical protein
LVKKTVVDDMTTNIVCCLSFLPECGNKYFVAGCDDGIKIYDFEHARLLQAWLDLYGAYCDCVKFVNCKDLPKSPNKHYLISRGVELVCEDDPTNSELPPPFFLSFFFTRFLTLPHSLISYASFSYISSLSTSSNGECVSPSFVVDALE